MMTKATINLATLLAVTLMSVPAFAQVSVNDLVGVGVEPAQAEKLAQLGNNATIAFAAGSAAAPSLYFSGDPNSGLFWKAADDIAVTLAGSQRFLFDASGHQSGANIIPDTDNAYNLGTAALEWSNIFIDGTANLDALINDGSTVLASGTNLPDTPVTGQYFLDTNDGACDDANDSGGTVVCVYNGSGWIVLGNSGS